MLKRSIAAAVLSLAVAAHVLANVPKSAPTDRFLDSAPAACNAFGLTPRAAARERREMARREYETQDALRSAQRLRSLALKSINPMMPPGATPPAMTITAAALVRASVGSGITVNAAVIHANDQLNARKYYIYDPEGHLLAETETTTASNPAIEWEYLWFNDEPLAQINAKTGEIAYYFNEHVGTPIIQTNQLGQIVWQAEYEPFGGIFAIRVGEERYQPLRLPGQIADIGGPEPDVYYNVHRYYRASFGRYTQPDPLLNPAFAADLQRFMGDDAPTPDYGSYAWYSYASNNPVNRLDPLGLKDFEHCTPTGDVIKDSRYAGEVIMHGVRHSKYDIVRRWCFFRCYCNKPDNCYKIPCYNFFCEKDHGTSVKLNIFDKAGVRPCPSHIGAARKQGKC